MMSGCFRFLTLGTAFLRADHRPASPFAPASLAALLLCLCAALFYSPPGAAALPNPLAGSSSGGEKVSDAQLEQSLNQVIQTLENDRQRADLLKS